MEQILKYSAKSHIQGGPTYLKVICDDGESFVDTAQSASTEIIVNNPVEYEK